MNIKELEHLFALDFKSPVFPQLANMYYNNYEFDKASKVCDIGLNNDPCNASGQYIKAKILLIENKLVKAEKFLKKIIILDGNNINALLALIEVSKTMQRSQTIINQYIQHAYALFPENKKINTMYNGILNKKAYTKNKKIKNPINKDVININSTMATQTMYKLMLKQNKFDVAQTILEIMMKKKDSNKSFIKKETKKLKSLINKN